MKVSELIAELQKLDPDMKVFGESEVSRWELTSEEIVPEKDGTLILGYKH